jgi:predicted nuclease of predicted toxin-antitoxin system
VRFLIDECLHTSLVDVARLHGHDGAHVRYMGLGGVEDWKLLKPIEDGGFTFVTNNAKDLRRLYARQDLPAGLVVLRPQSPPAEQRRLFNAALLDLEGGGDLMNEVMEVVAIDDMVLIKRYHLAA